MVGTLCRTNVDSVDVTEKKYQEYQRKDMNISLSLQFPFDHRVDLEWLRLRLLLLLLANHGIFGGMALRTRSDRAL